MQTESRGAVIAISSHVARGAVGNRSIVSVLEAFGHPVWSVPTVLLPFHPGHGASTRIQHAPVAFEAFLNDLLNSRWLGEVDAIVTGYMASPEQVRAVGRFVRAALVRKPQIRYLCDPVIGDANGLYVPQSTAAEIRDELIPLAAIATPNLHELAWLTGRDDIVDIGQAEAAARELGPEIVVVTSAPANIDGNTGNLLVDRDIPIMAEHPLISGPRNGAGDMFSGLFLACLLDGLQPSEALEKATALVYGAIAAASAKGSDELMPHARFRTACRSDGTVINAKASEIASQAMRAGPTEFVGVDGCPAGWIAVKRGIGSGPSVAVHQGFGDILASAGNDAFIAVDMPIGLPDFVHRGGRGPEQAVRPLLGERQSSVFSIPSRAAVEATDYGDACRIALETSDPPRKVSKQAFHLFAKIREIDALLAPALQERVREVHPEMAFLELNGGVPMRLPKKIKGRFNPAGIAERRNLLARVGFSGDFLEGKPPRGAAYDDFIDACVCSVIAERIALGIARSWPANPQRDSRGLHMAIWA